MQKKKKVKSRISFYEHNGIDIHIEIPPKKKDRDSSMDLATYHISWSEDPAEFAKDLRAAADFVEHHGVKKKRDLIVDVD